MKLFRKEEFQKRDSSQQLKRRSRCGACGLWKTCNSPKMKETGKGKRGIFILAEAPGQAEDRYGEALVGESGKYLGSCLKDYGINLVRDCWKINSILCRPTTKDGKSRAPKDREIEYCRPTVFRTIKRLKPRVIILLGGMAVKSFLGHRFMKDLGGIEKWRGWAIPDLDHHCWVLPLFHPSYVLRSEKLPIVETVWERDLKNMAQYLDKPFPELPDADAACEILTDRKQIQEYLQVILKVRPRLLAFDYETSGLKPWRKGHRIACVSMCWQNNRAVAWDWKLTPIRSFRKIMEDEKIGKVAANMKMEDHWTESRARGIQIQGWAWDTMLAAHRLDNRKGITSLKFDVYRRFGVVDYSSELDPFLKSPSKTKHGANSFNRVFEAPREKLYLYNAKDSFYTYHLAIAQMIELGVLSANG